MTALPLADAFRHHVWATVTLIDACLPLSDEQLQVPAPGTYGAILDTMRHLVEADAAYLWVLTGGRRTEIPEGQLGLAELRTEMLANDDAWAELLASQPDPDAIVVRHRDDGTDSHAPMSIRLAQALHHGSDHRSQICTALTNLGTEPPDIDVWAFGRHAGRVFVTESAG